MSRLLLTTFILTWPLASAAQTVWSYQTETDPMTDEVKHFLFAFPDGNVGQSPFVRFGCYGPITDEYQGYGITLDWGQSMERMYPDTELNMVLVDVRFGSNDPMSLGWASSRDFRQTYPPDSFLSGMAQLTESFVGIVLDREVILAWSPRDFFYGVVGSGQTVFRANTYNSGALTFTLDHGNFLAEAVNMPDYCFPANMHPREFM